MASGVFDDALIKHLWSTDELRAIFSDRNRVQKWYDFEAALALEQAELGIIPRAAAQEIAARAKVGNVDIEAIAAEIRRIKHPLVPALKAVEKLCQDGHGEYIHFGPTTQDVLDTATVLQIKNAHAIFLRDLKAIGRELVRLAETHRATPMAGRTHGVQALPITFGHKCAIWLSEMGRHHERLRQSEPRVFVSSLVGAVGTQASYGPKARELDQRVARRLGLGVADVSWHVARDRLAEYACVLGMLGATLGKIANEIITLQHNEIDELAEPFSEGKVAAITNGNWAMGDYQKALGDKLAVAALPAGPEGPATPFLGVDGYYFSPNSQNMEAALEVALYLTNKASQTVMMNEAGHVPVRTDVDITDPLIQGLVDAFNAGATIRPQVPELGKYWSNFCGIEEVFEKGTPAADWVKTATENANKP